MGTNAGGEVIVLDSAGYGAFSIGKAISIIAPSGVYAGISVFSGDGIDVTAGASDTVILRGLTVNSQGGANGIVFNTGGTFHIENCVINAFGGDGIQFNGPGKLIVRDTISRGNGFGIRTISSTGLALVSIERCLLDKNIEAGLFVQEGTRASIRNSVASSGNFIGVSATPSGGSLTAELNIDTCLISNNIGSGSVGVSAGGFSGSAATIRISNSTVTNNGIGLQQLMGGSILSRGNNTVEGNTTADTQGTIGTYNAK
jgi:hypothetical protein